jgi:hypothetical protein
MISEPPSVEGALQVSDTEALDGVTFPILGTPGTVDGTTDRETADLGPVPSLFVAVTTKV